MKILILSFILYGISGLRVQDKIDYSPKSLYSELSKFCDSGSSELIEITEVNTGEPETEIQGKFFRVENTSGHSKIRYVYTGRVNSCRAGGCSMSHTPAANFDQEYFDYFVLYDSLPSVRLVKVYNYQATHGQEVSSRGWLKQFSGYDGTQNLQVGKNIDAISGATISVYGISIDIQIKTALLKDLLK